MLRQVQQSQVQFSDTLKLTSQLEHEGSFTYGYGYASPDTPCTSPGMVNTGMVELGMVSLVNLGMVSLVKLGWTIHPDDVILTDIVDRELAARQDQFNELREFCPVWLRAWIDQDDTGYFTLYFDFGGSVYVS